MKQSQSLSLDHTAPAHAPEATAAPADHAHTTRYRKVIVASALGWGLDGFDHTMFALALGAILTSLQLSIGLGGTISTASLVASAVGGMFGGALADRYGRVRVLVWVVLGFSVTTALTATAQNATQLVVWRTLEGLCFGAEWPVGVALLSEYAKAESRGRLMAFMQSAYSIGWAASTIAYYFVFSFAPAHDAWRWLFVLGLLPAIAIFIIRRGMRDRVATGEHKPLNPFQGIARLFHRDLRRTTLSSTLFLVGAHGNYYAIVSFLPLYLATERGLHVAGTTTFMLVQIVGGFIGYNSSGWFHDRFGRRPTQTGAFAFAIASIVAFLYTPVQSLALGYVLVFLVGMSISSVAGGLGAILSEQFPTRIRGAGVGFTYNVGRGIAAFGPMLIGFMASRYGLGWSMMVVGICLALLSTAALWTLPETRGKQIIHSGEV
ncbi:MFS transporter [Paraburkholderia unamae]|uniref:MFS family arabinose efflux permease n=1 Tax=Paraburkholderia unamae TaxID=219649 RepID=A0ABX5KKP5_9BURK|nr:MFS transporter [Paraburkholderia unamae]PVX80089.1 putative MFS family arabinose efflux permease [Paraburkholderia unamae]CAG9268557.1 Putative MFS family arabinose efflux permease [Paraburkholderia unamae]